MVVSIAAVALSEREDARASAFSAGNVVVYRVGDGAAGLVNTGAAVFLDEYTPAGTLVQSVALPTTVSGANKQLIASGTATSEGLLSRSADGRYLIATGYARDLGGAGSLSGTASSTVNRVVGRVDVSGTIDTSTALTDFADANNPRSATSDDGTRFWVAGGAGGARLVSAVGSTTSTQLSTTVTNLRQLQVFDGRLHVSSGSGTLVRVGTFTDALPTAAGQTITNLPGFITSGSPFSFFLADLDAGVSGVDTLYVADDGALALTKYSLVGGNWTANGTVGVDADDYRGLTATVSGVTVTLFATRKGGSGATGGGELVKLTDASGYNGAFSGTPTLLATAATNTAFRGVALAPVAAGDLAPVVDTTSPADGADHVAADATVSVTFSEAVTLDAGAIAVSCTASGAHPGALSGGPLTHTFTPDAMFSPGESCTVTVDGDLVHDADTDDPPDLMAGDYLFSFTVEKAPAVASSDPADAGTGVPVNKTITVTFDEPVSATAASFTLTCDTVAQPFAVGGGPVSFTIDPDADLPAGASCVVVVVAPSVQDSDAVDPPDAMAAIHTFSFTTQATPNTAPDLPSSVPALSGAGSDPTNWTVVVAATDADGDALTLTAIATTNAAVAPLANITITATANPNEWTVAVTPTGVGYADITLEVEDPGLLTDTVVLRYAASLASVTPSTTRFHYGTSDGSTALAIDADFVIVADDEDQVLRVYPRDASGLPVASTNLSPTAGVGDPPLGLTQVSGGIPREVDIEASARSGNTIYWLGSHSNSSGGSDRPNRERLFTTTLAGTGDATTLTFEKRYDFLEDDMIAWDNGNGHGLGAGALGLAASAASGVLPESAGLEGFNIEGLEFAPDGTTLYIAFRAPLLPTSGRSQALIVPLTNAATILVSTGGGTAGSATFGAPIFLDLGGRAIRSIAKNATGEYVIAAGPPDPATGLAPKDFRLFTWDGDADHDPVLRNATLSVAPNTPIQHVVHPDGASLSTSPLGFEGIIEVPAGPLSSSSLIQLVVDAGDTDWYGDNTISKELPVDNFQKFRTEWVRLGAPVVQIHDIQGAAHLSPYQGESVATGGIVVAVKNNGFWIQEPDATVDANDATSEGIFVFTSSTPTVSVGADVDIAATVTEFRPGCSPSCGTGTSAYDNLTLTELTSPVITVVSTGNPLPTAALVGPGGRVPPAAVISDDATGPAPTSVEDAGTPFDPANDGIDFWESLEGMRIRITDAIAVGPRQTFGASTEIAIIPEGPAMRTPRGGLVLQESDRNPERIFLADGIDFTDLPPLDVNDSFNGDIVGMVDYTFGAFKLFASQALPPVVVGAPAREVRDFGAAGDDDLDVATFNVENLSAADAATKFEDLAANVVANLKSPDIIVIEEVQDNNGSTNDSVVDATLTWEALIEAIVDAGGPEYDFRQINPVDDQDGGQPGGNIRVGFLFNPARVAFVDRPGGGATTSTTVNDAGGTPELSASPGRIDPTNAAFNSSRKPLVGEFLFNGHTVFVIGNHWNSKGGDDEEFGRWQPPVQLSEVQRTQQATIVRDFVRSILAIDSAAKVVVAGDLNDFPWSTPVETLFDAGTSDLTALVTTLPAGEQYTYVFEGNSQILDYIVSSPSLTAANTAFDVVHINAEYIVQTSDHDPSVARFHLPAEDLTPPVTTASVSPAANPAGWNNGPATLTLSATDEPGGSGVAATDYRVNGGALAAYTAPVVFAANGTYTVEFFSTDVEDNVETAQQVVIKIDAVAPAAVLLGAFRGDGVTPYVPGSATNKVILRFQCTDAGGSGLASGGLTVVEVTAPEGLSTYNGATNCVDNAGNTSPSAEFGPILIDTVKPVVAVVARKYDSGSAYVFGTWTKERVRIDVTCLDAGGTGIASNTFRPTWFFGNGVQTFAPGGRCVDTAGNVADPAPEFGGAVLIDMRRPTCSISFAPGSVPKGGAPTAVTVGVQGTDPLSGVAGITITGISPTTNVVGPALPATSGAVFTFTGAPGRQWIVRAEVTDNAGNVGRCTKSLKSR
ncbi:MAG: Ig-like domain-containing protein [Dehalococcoidia bacterium]